MVSGWELGRIGYCRVERASPTSCGLSKCVARNIVRKGDGEEGIKMYEEEKDSIFRYIQLRYQVIFSGSI